jgi:hypothetical protein
LAAADFTWLGSTSLLETVEFLRVGPAVADREGALELPLHALRLRRDLDRSLVVRVRHGFIEEVVDVHVAGENAELRDDLVEVGSTLVHVVVGIEEVRFGKRVLAVVDVCLADDPLERHQREHRVVVDDFLDNTLLQDVVRELLSFNSKQGHSGDSLNSFGCLWRP